MELFSYIGENILREVQRFPWGESNDKIEGNLLLHHAVTFRNFLWYSGKSPSCSFLHWLLFILGSCFIY